MRLRVAAVVMVVALLGVYAIVSEEEMPTPAAAPRDVSAAGKSGLPIANTSAGSARSDAVSEPIPGQPHEESTPASTLPTRPAAAAPNRSDTGSTSNGERASTAAKAAPVAEESPLDWTITGSNIEGYKLRTERAVVLSGSASAVLESYADTDASRFGALLQMASAKSFKGKRIELSGYIASADAPAGASIWLRGDDANGTVVAFENTLPRGIRGTQEWTYQNIVIDIPKEAVAIVYGAVLQARGKLYVDDLQFQVVDASVPLTGKPITPAPHLASGARSDPGREPRNLDFEETRIKAD